MGMTRYMTTRWDRVMYRVYSLCRIGVCHAIAEQGTEHSYQWYKAHPTIWMKPVWCYQARRMGRLLTERVVNVWRRIAR